MSGALQNSRQMTLPGFAASTCSRESEAGRSRCETPDGPTIGPSGPEVVPVSRSRSRGKAKAKTTSGTSGPKCSDSSRPGSLQQSLESRLRQRLVATGSLEYALTWKHWAMSSGPPICALRASRHRSSRSRKCGKTKKRERLVSIRILELCPHPISGSDCSGWPSAAVQNASGGVNPKGNTGYGFTLQTAVSLISGYPTPQVHTGPNMGENRGNGEKRARLTPQSIEALFAGYSTPTLTDHRRGTLPPRPHDTGIPLTQQVQMMTGYNTPRATDGSKGGPNQSGGALPADVAGFATPATRDYRYPNNASYQERSNSKKGEQLNNQVVHGLILCSSDRQTGKRGVLDPEFSRWLMGLPATWDHCSPKYEAWLRVQETIASEDSAATETPSSGS